MKASLAAACAAAVLALPCAAQEHAVPKMLQDISQGKGQWRVEILENTGMPADKKPPPMTMCTDNLAKQTQKSSPGKADSSCTQRVLKDTATEAVIETKCKDRANKLTMKRESDKSVLMEMTGSGGGAPERTIKMRYTSLGACSPGQGPVGFDRDSAQCQQIRAAAAKMPKEQAEKTLALCK
jgi:hypothetical protein